jgi:hypothetical protein
MGDSITALPAQAPASCCCTPAEQHLREYDAPRAT